MKIACIAQLVNVIAPIRTKTGGPAWATTIYYPYQFASLYGRGTALNVAVDSPQYNAHVAQDVNYLDVAAVLAPDGKSITVFAINRHLEEEMDVNMALHGFGDLTVIDHQVMGGDASKARIANTADQPDLVIPRKGDKLSVDGGELTGRLPAFSYSVIRLAVG